MNPLDITQARDPDLRASIAALGRASEVARTTAIQTRTALVIVRDGQLVRLSSEQLLELAQQKSDRTP